jgi:hypothetical protein
MFHKLMCGAVVDSFSHVHGSTPGAIVFNFFLEENHQKCCGWDET